MIRRFKLTLAYQGTNYHGWQIQPDRATVQQTVAEALEKFLPEKITLIGASRTDAGVHALGQVAHFDSETALTPFRMQMALAAHLPADISVIAIEEADAAFHAQHAALLKQYRYFFYLASLPYTFWDPYAWRLVPPLDVDAMKEAARILVGKHNFSAFCASDSTAKTFVREVTQIAIEQKKEQPFPFYVVNVQGKGFLKFMIRTIVGTLVEVGFGNRSIASVEEALASRDRRQAGQTAPAKGLTLAQIDYSK